MIAAQEKKYVLFGEKKVKWIWEDWELIRFRELWNDGASISTIAKELKTNQRSIGLLIQDVGEDGYIKQRRSGLYGY